MEPAAAPQKICVGCNKDVAGVKRFKDLAGNYYCEPCWNEHVAQERRAKRAALGTVKKTVATPSETPGSPAADEHQTIRATINESADLSEPLELADPPEAAAQESAAEQQPEGDEEPAADPMLAALAGAGAQQQEAAAGASDKPIPPPRRNKGPGKWLLYTLVISGVTLLMACGIMVLLLWRGPEKASKSGPESGTSQNP